MNPFLKIFAITLYELFVFILSYVIWHHQDSFGLIEKTASLKLAQINANAPQMKPKIVWKEFKEKNLIPQSFKLEVPYTVQAPYGNWVDPWQEFCEEAVILMITKYYKSQNTSGIIPKNEASGLMLYIMSREERILGYHKNTGADDIAKILKNVFGHEAKVLENISIEKIKEEILRYRPVIVPLAGRMLRNPYFSKGGPFYHTVLIIGYDDADKTFIVHESGTKFGREYKYNQQTLFEAIADWDKQANDLVNRKAVVVVE